MRIRAHVVWLVAAAVVPIMVFSAVMTVVFWRQQRAAFEDRFLERARAVSIALDREHKASLSALGVLTESAGAAGLDLAQFRSRAEQTLKGEESLSAISLLDPSGKQLLRVPDLIGTELPSLRDSAIVQQAIKTGQPAISGLMTFPDSGRFATCIAIPVMRGGEVMYVLLGETGQQTWLRFMSLYPVAPGATMTLLDQNRIIIARTLNNDQWVGRPPAPTLYKKSGEMSPGAYRGVGLEGQWFYSAHSRTSLSGWTVATGVPIDYVESSLRGSLIVMLLGIAGTGALAMALVIVFGRRIERPVRRLAALARSLGGVDADVVKAPTSKVQEIDEVAETLVEASALIRRRSAERDDALAKETAARAEAERASRSKDEFLAMLGHELRNPLGAITSAAAVLDHAARSDAAAVQAREVIARQTGHLVGLVDDLLDVSRATTGKISLVRQVVELSSVGRECLATLRATGKLAGHEVALEAQPVWVDADVTRMEQVITNLLVNAVKYTPPTGVITFEIRPDGDKALVVVRDTGIGIATEMLPLVFDLFVQSDRALDRAQGGLGIGLTLVRRIVELHGGSVEAASDGPGQGSVFTVRLPRVEAVASRPSAAAPVAVAREADARRVLIVEDNDDARDMLRAMLTLWGHEVEEARDADAALACLERQPPDIALVDIGLPGRDGYALARQLRGSGEGRQVFLVALTGYGQPEDYGRAIDAGFDAHLVKPVDPDRLVAIIASSRKR